MSEPQNPLAKERTGSLAPPHSTLRPATLSSDAPLPESGVESLAPDAESPGLADEQPAARHLAARAVTLDWERRADWLEAEARAQPDAATRARLLLAASEVRAMLGARTDARRLALQAANQSPAPAFAARQARALFQVQTESATTLKSLREEAATAPSPTLRAHAEYLGAELLRLVQRDEAAAEPWLSAAEQSDPADCRATLQRLAQQLAHTRAPPDLDFSPDESFSELRHATGQIRQLRGDEAPRGGTQELAEIPLLDTQRALARGDLAEAAEIASQLEAQAGLRPAIRWLRLLWRAAAAPDAPELLPELRRLVREAPGRLERRALASRALAARDGGTLGEALDDAMYSGAAAPEAQPCAAPDEDPGQQAAVPPVFSSLERAVLTALMSPEPTAGGAPGRSLADAPALEPLYAALNRLRGPHVEPGPGALPSELEFALGRRAAIIRHFSELGPATGLQTSGLWSTLLDLERQREAGDWAGLALALPKLASLPRPSAECHFLSGVFAELAAESDAARDHYQSAMLSATTREAAVRVQSSRLPDSAGMFRALSAHTSDTLLRSMLLTEALFRLAPDAPELDALAEEAGRTHPALPFAYQLAELAARMRGDRARVTRWLGRQRERARVSGDFTLSCIQEASFIAQTDRALAAERLEELTSEASFDLSLQRLRERWGDVSPSARAHFRHRAAPALGARGREFFLAEAVALYERAGEPRAALATAREMTGQLGQHQVERSTRESNDLEQLAASWSRLAREIEDPDLACDHYDRLTRLELERGAQDQALSWQRERLKLKPGSLGALHLLEKDGMAAGQEAALEWAAIELFDKLPLADGVGYAFLAARLKIDRGAFHDARALAARARALATPPLWALRLDTAYARDAGDDHALLAIYRSLRERASEPLDAATLSLRAAEAAARLGQTELARDEIQRAFEIAPENVVVLAARAEILRSHGDYADAADAFETWAATAQSRAQQVDALYQAGVIWLDVLGDRARGMLALQEAAAIDSPHAELLGRLQQLRSQSGDFEGLSDLLERHERRLLVERRSLLVGADAEAEIARASALVETGHVVEAGEVLEALLGRQPEHAEALNASAELHFRARSWNRAAQAWRRVVDGAAPDGFRLPALRGLGSLYEGELADPERALLTYAEILKVDPEDLTVRRRLIRGLVAADRSADAVVHQRELVARARGDEERRQYLLELVELCGQSSTGQREAEALLEQAHRTWPESPQVLKAEVDHYRRAGNHGSASVIIERAINSAQNAIYAGRLEPGLFRSLEVATRLAGDLEMAGAAQAAFAVLHGQSASLSGAGWQAGLQSLDDLTSPRLLSSGFRRIMYDAGAAIERAYSVDPHLFEPEPVPEPLSARVAALAAAFGLPQVRVASSARLGCDCTCLKGDVVYVFLGPRLLEHADPRVVDFLLLRALKIAQANTSALSRMSAFDVWAAVAGFLACFAPAWQAEGADAQRLIAARNKIRPHVTATPEPELTALMAALTSNLVPQAAELGEAIWRWTTRVALLGVGDLGLALDSLWAAAERGPNMPRHVDARIGWIANDPHAGDLVRYSVSEAYIEARRRAGLTASPR
jgi:tetratricopeptide (TPR) repeat protein